MTSKRTYHDSWHQFAPLRLALRPDLRLHRQRFRGEPWLVLEDPMSNQFFKFSPAAWRMLGRLDGRKTLEEIWQESMEIYPHETPGQYELVQLLAQLHGSNLLTAAGETEAQALFRRQKKRENRELQSRLMSFMFARFNLFDPDDILKRTLPAVRWLFSWVGAGLWLIVVGLGLKTLVDHGDALWAQGSGVLAPGNLGFLYLGMILLAFLHEAGHAYACRYWNGEVHRTGIMLMVLTPLPFVDTTSSWSFRRRRHRLAVAGAGMIVEIFVAAIAALIWGNTGPGSVNALAFNLMFAASVSTLLFNINPLLRFDGYYILSDLLGMPNLYARGQEAWVYLCKRFLFGVRQVREFSDDRREALILLTYGLASLLYRVFLFGVIFLFVSSNFLLLGLVLGAFAVITWVLVPLGKLLHYLWSHPELNRSRGRASVSLFTLIGLPLLALAYIPAPMHVRAEGVVQAQNFHQVTTAAPGVLAEAFHPSGTEVKAGALLFRLVNPSLIESIAETAAICRGFRTREQIAREAGRAELEALVEMRQVLEARLEDLHAQERALLVRAPLDGIWTAPPAALQSGRWLGRGTALGQVIDPTAFVFEAVVGQAEAGSLFSVGSTGAFLRLRGQAAKQLQLDSVMLVPGERRQLPSAALGWSGGGQIETTPDDPEHLRAAEGFFALRAPILVRQNGAVLRHGMRGVVRIEVAPRPYLAQAWEWLQRLLLDTYRPADPNRAI